MFLFPTWQVAVETAQVVAGLVRYPDGNPFGVYHVKLWTILHHVCAPLLLAGVSEIAVSKMVSGLLGMVSFQALTMIVFAFSRDAVLAIGAPIVIVVAFLETGMGAGGAYPIRLLGVTDTYGVLGLSTCVLVAGLLGSGHYRLGGVLLGLAPAVHPSLGFWLIVAVTLCFVWDFKRLVREWRPALPYCAAGCAVTALSLCVQITMMHGIPDVAASDASRYLAAFVNSWDTHRRPIGLLSGDAILNADLAVVALIWLVTFRKDLPASSVFLLRFVIVCAVIGLSAVLMSHLPPERLPSLLLILMPTRVLNINVMMFPALLLGLIGVYRRSRWWSWISIAVYAGLLFGNRSVLWFALQYQPAWAVDPYLVLAIATGALLWMALKSARENEKEKPAGSAGRVSTIAQGVLVGVAAIVLWIIAAPQPFVFRDRTNDPFFKQMESADGMLLTGGPLHLVQLRARRPVLLDGGGLDTLPYAPETGPQMERILRDVYDIDFFHPPDEVRRQAIITINVGRAAWERHSLDEWREIGRAYHVTQVVAPADWHVRLPLMATADSMRLYRVPE